MTCETIIESKERFEWIENRDLVDIKVKEIVRNEILEVGLVRDVGFADLSQYAKVPGGSTPFEYLNDARTAVVYVAETDDVIQKFGKWYVVSLTNFLKKTNDKVAAILRKHGLYGLGIIDERLTDALMGKVSFRQIAVLAGLGTLGKSTCVIHPRLGPNILIGVVLTNSYIPRDEPLEKELCSDCDACLRKCPVRAIDNDSFNRRKCKDRRKILGKGCGTPCIVFCPVGADCEG